jgi:thiol-disulfide isomerase/thioredoxin
MHWPAAWLLLWVALLTVSPACGAGGDHITAVDATNFDSVVVQSLEAWVLEFMSPRCGTCQELSPLYADLAARNSKRLHFGSVDIDTEEGMALAQRLDVLAEGVPNVRAFTSLGSQHGVRIFSGWKVPSAEELQQSLMSAVASVSGAFDASEGARLMKA